MLSEILPHLISPKSTFCKIFTQIKYTNIVYSLLMNFLNFEFDILFTKKVLRFKKINAINREIEVGNVGIGKNRISDTRDVIPALKAFFICHPLYPDCRNA